MGEFFQEAPQLGHKYDDDRALRGWLEWRLPVDRAAVRWREQDLAPLPDPSRAGAPGIAAGRS